MPNRFGTSLCLQGVNVRCVNDDDENVSKTYFADSLETLFKLSALQYADAGGGGYDKKLAEAINTSTLLYAKRPVQGLGPATCIFVRLAVFLHKEAAVLSQDGQYAQVRR
jgi:hypothetical protein